MRLARTILALAIAAAAPARAADVDALEDLSLEELLEQTIVVSTARMKTTVREAPAGVYVITAEQIQERGYRTLSEALEDVPGFDVVHVYGIYPELIHQRGLPGNNQRTLVTVDGVLDDNIFEGAILGGTVRFPLANVRRIEVLAGPASALYGANAFNGVINIVTKDGEEEPGAELALSGGSSDLRFPSARVLGGAAAGAARGQVSLGNKPLLYAVSAQGLVSGGPDFSGVQSLDASGSGFLWSPLYDNSQERGYNLGVRLGWGPFRLAARSWEYRQGQGTFANGTQQVDTDLAGNPGSAWDFRNDTLVLGHLAQLQPGLSLDSEANARRTELLPSSHDAYRAHPDAMPAIARPDDLVFEDGWRRVDWSLELRERLTWEPDPFTTTTVGLEGLHSDVPFDYARANPGGDRRTYDNLAGYLQEIIRPLPWLALVAGYRFDHNSNYGSSHTPRLGAIVTPSDDLTVKLLFGTGFRGPTAWEQFSTTAERTPNPGLVPERLTSGELFLGARLARRLYLSASGYWNEIRDLLVNDVQLGSGLHQNQNAGKARVLGLEVQGDLRLPLGVSAFANATVSRGTYRDLDPALVALVAARGAAAGADSGDVPTIAPLHLNAGVSWRGPRGVSLHLRANVVSARTPVATNPLASIPAHALFHANVRWDGALGVRGLSAELLAKNLLDAQVFDPGIRDASGGYYPTQHPLERRNLWLGAGYRF